MGYIHNPTLDTFYDMTCMACFVTTENLLFSNNIKERRPRHRRGFYHSMLRLTIRIMYTGSLIKPTIIILKNSLEDTLHQEKDQQSRGEVNKK